MEYPFGKSKKGKIMGLNREQKLKVLQDSYKEWTERFPNETDDQEDSHLYEIQQEALRKAEILNS